MFAAERIAQIVENCQTLVREESLSGQEGGVVQAIEAMMRAYGFHAPCAQVCRPRARAASITFWMNMP